MGDDRNKCKENLGAIWVIESDDYSQRGKCYSSYNFDAQSGVLAPKCGTIDEGLACYDGDVGLNLRATDVTNGNEICTTLDLEIDGNCSNKWFTGVSLGFACNVIGRTNNELNIALQPQLTSS